ncbi:hypothetical protein EVA_19203, partial [gut metagenome]
MEGNNFRVQEKLWLGTGEDVKYQFWY